MIDVKCPDRGALSIPTYRETMANKKRWFWMKVELIRGAGERSQEEEDTTRVRVET